MRTKFTLKEHETGPLQKMLEMATINDLSNLDTRSSWGRWQQWRFQCPTVALLMWGDYSSVRLFEYTRHFNLKHRWKLQVERSSDLNSMEILLLLLTRLLHAEHNMNLCKVTRELFSVAEYIHTVIQFYISLGPFFNHPVH